MLLAFCRVGGPGFAATTLRDMESSPARAFPQVFVLPRLNVWRTIALLIAVGALLYIGATGSLPDATAGRPPAAAWARIAADTAAMSASVPIPKIRFI